MTDVEKWARLTLLAQDHFTKARSSDELGWSVTLLGWCENKLRAALGWEPRPTLFP